MYQLKKKLLYVLMKINNYRADMIIISLELITTCVDLK